MDRKKLTELEEMATPRPWDVVCDFVASDNMEFSLGSMGDRNWDCSSVLAQDLNENNARYNKTLVAETRNLLPELLALWKAVEDAQDTLKYLSQGQVFNLFLALEALNKKATEPDDPA